MRTWLVLLAACQPPTKTDPYSSGAPDDDLDGYGEDVDCADDDPDVHPGALEICDGIDNNCDGLVDEGATEAYLPDADADGFVDSDAPPVSACERPEGHLPASAASDCDDADPLTHPGAPEYCDGIDNDCDGQADPTSCRPLASSDVVLRGEEPGHRLGTLVAAIGDLTGDGTPDILIGAPEAEPAGNSSGLAYVMAGPLTPSATISEAVATLSGDSLGDRIGTSAGGEQDFDGDGQVDLVVGGWGDPTYGAEAGSALVYLGPLAGDREPADAAFEVLGSTAGDSAGLAVALLGDMNGDGRSEVAIGAPNVDAD
ncbi:MAG: MopE-related protein, partial [Myxococcota bacterium]|nr:MopE-related protein [Myxococcota bacterium]